MLLAVAPRMLTSTKAEMMTEEVTPYVIDVPAIKAWAAATGNEASAVLGAIQDGRILLFNRVWDSAKAAYPDECARLPKDDFECERCTEEHRLAAAALAQKLNAKFPVRGPYDDAIEWMVAGVALSGPYTIVTDERRKKKFEKVDGLSVITYEEMVGQL
jgi:hypothetical protein